MSQENAGAKKEIQKSLQRSIFKEKPVKVEAKSVMMIWTAVMAACKWNKKEDLVLPLSYTSNID